MYRWHNWKITEKSYDYLESDAQTLEFRVEIPSDGEITINYAVHYTW